MLSSSTLLSFPVFGQTSSDPTGLNQNYNGFSLLAFWNQVNSNLSDANSTYQIYNSHNLGIYHTNIRTFVPWKTLTDNTLRVSIVEIAPLSADQLGSVTNPLVGYGTIKFDDSTSYISWNEALQSSSRFQTKTPMPTNIMMLPENSQDADVIIYVSDEKNHLYSGYTANVVEHQKIVKSNIIIYDINNLNQNQISSIVRHEFGHALGLSHCSSVGDLMSGIVPVPSYVSESHVAALLELYQNEATHTGHI